MILDIIYIDKNINNRKWEKDMLKKKILKTVIAIAIAMPLTTQLAFAHSGRTDSSGGHKDNKNASGLGFYHYHCGGHPAHLHNGGVCPYSGTSSSSGGSSSSSSNSNSNTSSQQSVIAAKKKEATDSGYNSGYEAGCNGHVFNDTNSSSYSTEYKSGYKNGYEKGKSELESNINNAYNQGYEVGYKCESENNTHTLQAVKDSYSKGYNEGKRVYIEENTNNYIKYGEEDANNFAMRTFEDNVFSELKTSYTNAYNKKTEELKKAAYDEGYVQALKSIDLDSSRFKNEEEVNSCNEGYSVGLADLDNEKTAAYEAGHSNMDYVVPERFSVAQEVVMASYNEGVEEFEIEKDKQSKAIAGTMVLLAGGAGATIFIRKKKKANKVNSNKENIGL